MFPTITNISQVLPFIKDYPEFRVNVRDGFTVIDYMITDTNTFKDVDPYARSMRQECRGIAFDNVTGEVVRRALHKFHNVNENEYSQDIAIDISRPHDIEEKLDGSCVMTLKLNGLYRLGTRAGITEHAMKAEVFVVKNPHYDAMIREWVAEGYTCIFEWLSDNPEHQIVIKHQEPKLILTAIRDNNTGEYIDIHQFDLHSVEKVKKVNRSGNIKDILNYVKTLEGEEGVVIKFDDGNWYKVKSDWYMSLHHGKDMVRFEKDVIRMVLDGTVDDVYPVLDERDSKRVKDFAHAITTHLNGIQDRIHYAVAGNLTPDGEQSLNSSEFHDYHQKQKTFKGFHNVAMGYFRMNEPDDSYIWRGMTDNIIRKCGSQTTVEQIRHSMLGGLKYADF